jgi:hypothetical protein
MPSVYSPFKMDTSFHKMPFEEMSKYTEMVKNKYETNAQSLDNFSSALSDIKTYPEAMPELQAKLKRYQDFTDQSAKLASTDPEKYLQLSNQLRETGRELVRDMKSGDISKYTNAYNNWSTGYAADMKNPAKKEADVAQYYTNKAKEDIANLKAGKPITQGSAPEYYDDDAAFKEKFNMLPTVTYIDSVTGNTMEGKDPAKVAELKITQSREPLRQAYIQAKNQFNPSILGPVITKEIGPNGKPVYLGLIRTLEWTKGEPKYVRNPDGTLKYGDTQIKEDAMTNDEYNLQKTANEYGYLYGGGRIKLDSNGDPISASGKGGKKPELARVVSSILPDKTPIYDPNAIKDRLKEIDSKLIQPDLPTDAGNILRQERADLVEQQQNSANIHAQARDISRRKLLHGGESAESLVAMENIDTLKKQVDIDANNYTHANPLTTNFGVLEKKYFTALNAYKAARVTKDKYNSIYFDVNKGLQEAQVSNRKALGLGTDEQKLAAEALLADPKNLSIEGNTSSDSARDKLIVDLQTSLDITKLYRFENIESVGGGKSRIRVIKLGETDKKKQTIDFILSREATEKFQEAIRTGNYGPDTKLFASGLTDAEAAKTATQIESIPAPSNNTYYGAKKEFKYKGIQVYARRTENGSLIAKIVEPPTKDFPAGRYLTLPMITGSDANAQLIKELESYNLDPVAYKQNREVDRTKLLTAGEKVEKHFVDPDTVGLYPTDFEKKEEKREEEENIKNNLTWKGLSTERFMELPFGIGAH